MKSVSRALFVLALLGARPVWAQSTGAIVNPTVLEFDQSATDMATIETFRVSVLPLGGTPIDTDVPKSAALSLGASSIRYRIDLTPLTTSLPTSGTLTYTVTLTALSATRGPSGRSDPSGPFLRVGPPAPPANVGVR